MARNFNAWWIWGGAVFLPYRAQEATMKPMWQHRSYWEVERGSRSEMGGKK